MFTAKISTNLVGSAGRNGNRGGEPSGTTSRLITHRYSAQSLPLPSKPKVPLLTGSLLVLLTLFLPIAYSQCGAVRSSGLDCLLGFDTWPGSLGAISYAGGRVPYFLTLVLATMTLLLLLAAVVRRSVLHTASLNHWLFATAGTLFLFTIGDFFWFQLASGIGDFLKAWLSESDLNFVMIVLAALVVAVAVVCLRSSFLCTQRWIVWLFRVAIGVSLIAIGDYVLLLSGVSFAIPADWVDVLTISPSILYLVVPLGLWYRFGLSRRADFQTQWPGIRRRITVLYVPAALFDLVALGLEMRPGRLWGLFPYFAGLSLICWGYLGLQRRTSAVAGTAQAGASGGMVVEQRAGVAPVTIRFRSLE
jgi:hypothetical protein